MLIESEHNNRILQCNGFGVYAKEQGLDGYVDIKGKRRGNRSAMDRVIVPEEIKFMRRPRPPIVVLMISDNLFYEPALLQSTHKLQESPRRGRRALAAETYEAFQFPSLERLLIRAQIFVDRLRLQARQAGYLAREQRPFGNLEHVHAVIVDPEEGLTATVRGEQVRKDEVAVRLRDVSHAPIRGMETRGRVREIDADAGRLVHLGGCLRGRRRRRRRHRLLDAEVESDRIRIGGIILGRKRSEGRYVALPFVVDELGDVVGPARS